MKTGAEGNWRRGRLNMGKDCGNPNSLLLPDARRLGQPRSASLLLASARGLALFLGGFGLLNVLGNLWHPGFDANLWWLDLRRLTPFVSGIVIAAASLCLLVFGMRPPESKRGCYAISAGVGCLLAIALGNSVNFYALLARGQIDSHLPLPISLLIAASLALILARVWKPGPYRHSRRLFTLLPSLAVCGACALLFPLAQMFCFGKTDYRRPANVTVVLGARVYADGRPSDALADRVRTACKLYHAGLTQKLLFSGGPGDGPVHETESMKRMAVGLGVKSEDILLDEQGVNTDATARNTKQMLAQLKPSRVLVVSHFYHLPRIKLAYQREGLEVYTVPAKESYLLRQMPYNMAREVAALWVYYLRPLHT